MTLNIIQITQQISIEGFDVSPGWPSFAKWIKSQLPLREIVGYEGRRTSALVGYSDGLKTVGPTDRVEHRYSESVLSNEIDNLLMAPPLELSNESAKEYRHTLEKIGLLTRHEAYDYNKFGEGINQFRV